MADVVTKIADVVVPEIFGPYVQQRTQEKSRLVQSGAVVRDAALDADLAGGGLTFNSPSFQDLANDADNVSSDDETAFSDTKKIQTSREIAVRLSRNSSWSSMDLTQALAGPDPMMAIADLVAGYWARRAQAVFVATMTGVFADNAAAPAGTEHVINDMSFTAAAGFTASDFLAATLTMGDSMEDLALVMVHSVIFNKMQNANLIVYRDVVSGAAATNDVTASTAIGTAGNVPVSRGEIRIPTYLGRQVIVDDGLPTGGGSAYESWLFGTGAVRWGLGAPKIPVEVDRVPSAGNGGGQDKLFSRVEWAMHPVGNAYAGTAPNGGPSNAATANNLAAAGSWQRVYPERKQIKVARLITTGA